MTDFQIFPAARQDLEVIADLFGRSKDWVSYAVKRGRRSDTWIWVAKHNERLAGMLDYREAWIGRGAAGGSRVKRIGKKVLDRNSHQSDSILLPYQYGRIHDLAVVHGAHYQEAGTALVNHCLRQMQHSTLEDLQIELNAGDEAARELFHGLSFHAVRYLLAKEVPEESRAVAAGIRPAEMDDLPQLAGLVRQEIMTQLQPARSLRLQANINWQRYVAEKIKSPNIRILVCVQNGLLEGYVEMRLLAQGQETKAEAYRAYVEDIFIKETSRRQGMGKRLLRQIDYCCQQAGIRETRTEIWAANEASLSLFRSMGYELFRLQFSRPGLDHPL